MPVVKLSAIKGTDIPSLVNALERQRKELEFILSALDDDNVLAINGTTIKQGVIAAEHVTIGAETTFQAGYDPSGTPTYDGEIEALDGRLDTAESKLFTAENNIASAEDNILALQEDMGGIPTQIENSRIIDSLTADPVDAPVGKMWLRSDL